MTFGEFIANYRNENSLSQRQFALKAGLSNGLIAMLERGENPSTHKPIVPTMDTVYAVSKAMNISLDELLRTVDNFPIKLNCKPSIPPELTDEETHLLVMFRSMNRAGRSVLIAAAEGFASSAVYQADATGDKQSSASGVG